MAGSNKSNRANVGVDLADRCRAYSQEGGEHSDRWLGVAILVDRLMTIERLAAEVCADGSYDERRDVCLVSVGMLERLEAAIDS